MTTAPKALAEPQRNRQTEEPVGRWDDRCEYAEKIDYWRLMVCDRKVGHRGLHQGRVFNDSVTPPSTIGWWKARVSG